MGIEVDLPDDLGALLFFAESGRAAARSTSTTFPRIVCLLPRHASRASAVLKHEHEVIMHPGPSRRGGSRDEAISNERERTSHGNDSHLKSHKCDALRPSCGLIDGEVDVLDAAKGGKVLFNLGVFHATLDTPQV